MLEALFTDRLCRKSIKESVLNAEEVGIGECEACGSKASLIRVFDHCVCESCCNDLIENTVENYDNVYESSVPNTHEVLSTIGINEAYLTPNKQKLEDEANKSFGGSIPDLLKSYNIYVSYWDENGCYTNKGKVQIADAKLSSGKSKVNRFIDDFDCSFATEKSAQRLQPDGDGYSATVRVAGKSVVVTPKTSNSVVSVPPSGSKPATTSGVTPQSSSSVVTNVASTAPVSGDTKKLEIKISSSITITCEDNSSSNGSGTVGFECYTNVNPNDRQVFYVKDSSDTKKISEEILNQIAKHPELLFTAFTDDDVANGYVVNKYPAYSYQFDDKSFDGNGVSMVLALNGVPYKNTRILLDGPKLFERVKLDKAMREAMDGRLSKFYPTLFDGSANIKTSIGKALVTLDSVEASKEKSDMGLVKFTVDIGNTSFSGSDKGVVFQKADTARNCILDNILKNIDKIIPDWNDTRLHMSASTNKFSLNDLDYRGNKFSIGGEFNVNALYDSGSIEFKVSIIDIRTGNEEPKSYVPTVYTQAGTKLIDFLSKKGTELYIKYFEKTGANQALTQSAVKKLGTPSKKVALYSKLADIFMGKLSKASKIFRDLSCDVETFNVDPNGKIISAEFRIFDEDNYVAGTSDDLLKLADASKFFKYLKANVDNTPRSLAKYGPSVVYTVKNLDDLYSDLELSVLEGLIREAFNLVVVNETTGRKEFYI